MTTIVAVHHLKMSAEFLQAAEDVKHLPEKPGNDVLLSLCKFCGVGRNLLIRADGLYKQATVGKN